VKIVCSIRFISVPRRIESYLSNFVAIFMVLGFLK